MTLTDPAAPRTLQNAANVTVSSGMQEIASPVTTLEAPNYTTEAGVQNPSQNRTTTVQKNQFTPASPPIFYDQPGGPPFNSVLREGQMKGQFNLQSPPANAAANTYPTSYPLPPDSGHSANYGTNFYDDGMPFGNKSSPPYPGQHSRPVERTFQTSNQAWPPNNIPSSLYDQANFSNVQARSPHRTVGREDQYPPTINQNIHYSNQENRNLPYLDPSRPTSVYYQHQSATSAIVNNRRVETIGQISPTNNPSFNYQQSPAPTFDAYGMGEPPSLVFDATGLYDDPRTSSAAPSQLASPLQAADQYDCEPGSTRALTRPNLRDQSRANPSDLSEDPNPAGDCLADDFNDNDSVCTITEGVRNTNLTPGHTSQKSSSHSK
jgi:hypothetical protein